MICSDDVLSTDTVFFGILVVESWFKGGCIVSVTKVDQSLRKVEGET